MTQRPPWDLEPAVGRVLVTKYNCVYEIVGVNPLMLRSVYTPEAAEFETRFYPKRGAWIAPDLLTLETWVRLNGVRLR